MPALQLVALTIAVLATVAGVAAFVRGAMVIVRTVRRGGPAPDRAREPGQRTAGMLRDVLGHRRFRLRPGVRAAHWVVMVAFPVLFLTLVTGYGQIADPRYVLPVVGGWAPYEWAVELFAWGGLLAIAGLIVVRQVRHPRRGQAAAADESAARRGPGGVVVAGPSGERASRFFGSNAGQAYLVEGVILGVSLAVVGLRALEYALGAGRDLEFTAFVADATAPVAFDPTRLTSNPWWQAHTGPLPAFDPHFPLTAWLGSLLAHLSIGALATAVVVLATLKILLSMAWMVAVGARPAMGVAWHRFLAVVNVWARRELDGRPALGAAAPLRDAAGEPLDLTTLEDLPEDLRLGVGRIEDLTWKGVLDLATCTECGRCQEQCPAWTTDKPLSPKLLVTQLRDHAFATAGPTPGASGDTSHAGVDVLALVGDVISPEELWDCTTCGACVQQCPVDIEHVDLVLDLRRHEVLAKGEAPAEIGQMLTKVERRGNPWGLAPKARMAWAEGLDFEVPVVGRDVPDLAGVECLFWVGCAGAYDDRGRSVARSVAELLHVAGVSFAVLGPAESCSGDPARRAGNEALFQQLAHQAIDTLNEAKARRIVVTCAHCFNTIANEYPALGGHYSVMHHTELLAALVAEGRLRPVRRDPSDPDLPTVTYHDPCYLGRHNEVYSPPRGLLQVAGARVVEMPRTGERSFCCGGGGARVWAEETRGRRIADDRMAEARGTGAAVVATACPFCTVMLGSAGGAAEGEQQPVVRDVAEILLDSVRRSPGASAGAEPDSAGDEPA